MALLPSLRGTVKRVSTLSANSYYKSEIVLENITNTTGVFSDTSGDQTIRFPWPLSDLGVKVGDKVTVYAFNIFEEGSDNQKYNFWEGEGLPRVIPQ